MIAGLDTHVPLRFTASLRDAARTGQGLLPLLPAKSPSASSVKVGASGDTQAYRVINFCDLEAKTEFRLVTNLPVDGEAAVSDDEIRDIYRLRWGVELLWKFLKMHLKLDPSASLRVNDERSRIVDKLITKNVNGITI